MTEVRCVHMLLRVIFYDLVGGCFGIEYLGSRAKRRGRQSGNERYHPLQRARGNWKECYPSPHVGCEVRNVQGFVLNFGIGQVPAPWRPRPGEEGLIEPVGGCLDKSSEFGTNLGTCL